MDSAAPNPPSGSSLDGLTVLRITHAFERGGGLEQYLDDLNSILSARNRMHTVQIRLSHGEARRESELCGQARITTFYLPAMAYSVAKPVAAGVGTAMKEGLRRWVRDNVLYQPLIYRLFTRRLLEGRPAPRGLCDPGAMVQTVRKILAEFPIDCAVLHSAGDQDSQLALRELAAAGVPAALVNHFANDRFLNSSMRQQVRCAVAIGMVGRTGLPDYFLDRSVYVGDGVDLDFFDPLLAREVPERYPAPRVLLPARLVASKGHFDLIEAAALARRKGVVFHLYFAGRSDSLGYVEALTRRAEERGVGGQVHFLGGLGREQLRDWYAASVATALPTHHHEGLPRVTIESQAMGVPPVAYDIGGVRESFVDGRTGFLLRVGDTGGLASALTNIVTGAVDGRAMGRAGRILIQNNFSFPVLARRHEAFTLAVSRHGRMQPGRLQEAR